MCLYTYMYIFIHVFLLFCGWMLIQQGSPELWLFFFSTWWTPLVWICLLGHVFWRISEDDLCSNSSYCGCKKANQLRLLCTGCFYIPGSSINNMKGKPWKSTKTSKTPKRGWGGTGKGSRRYLFSRTKLHLVVLTSQMPRYLHSLLRSKFGTDLSKAYIILYVLFLSAGESESAPFPTQKMCTLAVFVESAMDRSPWSRGILFFLWGCTETFYIRNDETNCFIDVVAVLI